jgi:hypothetical protein
LSPISRGGLSCRFYHASEPPKDDYQERFLRNLKNAWFHEIDPRRGEERSTGWVHPQRILDRAPEWERINPRPYIMLGLRVDRKAISPPIFRAFVQGRIESLIRERGMEKIGRAQRKAIEEEVRADLLAEQTPMTQVTEMAWNTATGLVTFAATSESLNIVFSDYFIETFECELRPLNPFMLADAWCVERGLDAQLDAISPALFASPTERLAEAVAALEDAVGREED